MTLSGSLEVFPLEEVLRLLARSKKTGCLRVDCPDVSGRVFLAGGALTLVTTGTDDELKRHVVNAGLVSESDIRRVEAGAATLVDVLTPGVSPALLTDLVREQIVEGVYQLRRTGSGEFDFGLDVQPRYPTGQTFDAEVAVSESERRAAEWADIHTVLTDLSAPLRMARRLPDETDVTITPATWRVLSALDGGASVVGLAESLGMSRFRTAREIAGLLRASLVEAVPAPPAQEVAGGGFPVVEVEPAAEPFGRPSWLVSSFEAERPEPALAESPVAESPVAESPVAESPVAESSFPGVPPAWVSPEPGSETDTFLESVFSEFEGGDGPAEDEAEGGFSMGLLRRRRMGGTARDVDGSDL